MTLWWIGNVVLVAVVVPAVVLLLTITLRAALRLGRQANDVAEHAQALATHHDGWEDVTRTRELARKLRRGLERPRGSGGYRR